ncbi:predicted protein [Uncinocarpus reesii 1704]|uniref:Methyltransferase tdiE n=1 Tax=Uncinocarpus reesii (strain UAMH 1704) TaxID=336963 RepID=C4JSD9_UNCRE|nr:uncharacterized protein UREG_05378 [Uncinocarpus reesii 1704]EEP80536.1 predicted protein [Uncinocarpus reesii 1704]
MGIAHYVPRNVTFAIDDAEADWHFHQKFDYIHGRLLMGSLNLKPGGYIEVQDIRLPFGCDDGTVRPNSTILQWIHLLIYACDVLERPIDVAKDHKRRMEEAGFVDVVEVVQKWPMNNWPKDPVMKEMGMWNLVNMLEGMHAATMAPFTRGLAWSPQEVELLLVALRRDVKDTSMHIYWPVYFVYGRKPLNAED